MPSTQEILRVLDHSNDDYYGEFVPLNHPRSYLIDARLNLFRSAEEWAVAAEILGYNPSGGRMELLIFYYGNCLIHLERYNNRDTNYYSVFPVDEASYQAATRDELLNPAATNLLVRGTAVPLSHNKAAYERAGIALSEVEAGRISMDEVGRLLITQRPDLFRATDAELHKSLPAHLRKILVLNEWHHQDFTMSPPKIMSEEAIRQAYKLNQAIGSLHGMSLEELTATIRAQEERAQQSTQHEWATNYPSSYETWQQLAQVLATGDARYYQPTLLPNTHWSNWPESGTL